MSTGICRAMALAALLVAAQGMAGTPDYDLSWHTVDGGGAMWSTGGTYELGGTIGQPDAGVMFGGDYELAGGFWHGGDEFCYGDLNGDDLVNFDDRKVWVEGLKNTWIGMSPAPGATPVAPAATAETWVPWLQ